MKSSSKFISSSLYGYETEVNAILGLVLPAWPETNSQMKPCEVFKLENWSTSTIERMVSVGREIRIPIGSAVEA